MQAHQTRRSRVLLETYLRDKAAASVLLRDASIATGLPPADADVVERFVCLGSRLWTEDEGVALDEVRKSLPLLRTLVHPDHHAALTLLAALGPAFWMTGHASEGYELAKAFSPPANGPAASIGGGECADLCFPVESWPAAPAAMPTAAFLQGLPAPLLLGCCLDGGGMNAYACTRYAEAAALHAHALHLADGVLAETVGAETGDARDAALLRSRALDGLGRVARESGEYDRSLALHKAAARAAVGLERRAGGVAPLRLRPEPRACVANAVSNAGVAAYRKGEAGLARRCHEEARRLRAGLGDLRGTSSSLGNLALLVDDAAEALALYRESLEIRRRLGDTWGIAGSHRAIASALLRRRDEGDEAAARENLQRALPIFASVADSLGVAECLESLALLAAPATPSAAAQLFGCAVAVRTASGAATDVVAAHEEAALLRRRHAAAWARGEQMSEAQALELATAWTAGCGPLAAAGATG